MDIFVYTDEAGQNVYLSNGTLITGDEAFRNYIVNDLGFSHAVADHHMGVIQNERRIANPNPKTLDQPAPQVAKVSVPTSKKKTTRKRKMK